jgi:hypothetical protein
MNPKKTPFTDAYVKEQQSTLSLGYKMFAAVGIVITVFGIIVLVFRPYPEGQGLLTFGMIFVLWAALSRQRLNTFRENLELYKMTQQLRGDKDVAERQ